MSAPKFSLRLLKIVGLIVLLLVPAGLFVGSFCSSPVPTPPIPKGGVAIHVEFKGISTAQFNQLTVLVCKLPTHYCAYEAGSTTERAIGNHNAYHGFWNSGFVDQLYQPNHPIPSPAVEAAMKASLEEFLKANKMNSSEVKLELKYGH